MGGLLVVGKVLGDGGGNQKGPCRQAFTSISWLSRILIRYPWSWVRDFRLTLLGKLGLRRVHWVTYFDLSVYFNL